ncbi:ATP-binding cassette sub-family B member 10, mitochondrial [Diabrotica virgifera virgifera]|uniref:ATP-binding cassette sub-family B member 10, mitochondrial n=1 Tax=Diabrotica virgifera virgifera TaxID=50390 RepID=A0ABM5JP31_DIAVI|nr:ATP-binding cassette sub-family B member 10, mitochondrial [Diabrotica virgifera virgifera]
MNVYSVIVSSHNLSKSLKLLKLVNSRRYFSNMSQKISQNKTYISVEIPETTKGASRGFFSRIFKRNKEVKEKQEPRLKKSELKRLFSLAKPEKWKLTTAIGFLVVSSTVTMSIPYSLGKILDIIYVGSGDSDAARARLNQVCGILLGVFVLGAICNYARVYLMSTAGYRMTNALRRQVFGAILRQEQGWFDKRPTGELVNRLSADTQIVGSALSQNISDGLRSLVMVFAGTGMMLYMSPQLALVGLAIVPPVAVVAVLYGRFVRKISRKVQDSLADSTKVAEERIANIRTVKSFAQEPREITSYNISIENVLKYCYKEAKARALFYGMTGFSGHIIIISVLYYGGVMVSSNTITVGNLSSFLLYAAYIGISVGGLSSFYSELNKSLGAATRIWEIIDREPTIPTQGGLIPMTDVEGHIEFKNVKFCYPSRSDIEIFKSLVLDIQPGKTLAVVGPSGSGKSTLAALLLRLYDPIDGAVYIDNQNIKELDPAWIKKHIGTVSQEPILFSCSIKENILYGADDPQKINDDEFIRICKEANVYEFVQNLPEGFETVVGERGVMLSGGQKQRVAIARALIKNPKILLLDEATSALDAQSEHYVQEALDRVMKGRTVLTIAHRLSTIQNADIIAVLQNGQIVEQGKYEQLLQSNGPFRELVQHQTFSQLMDD